MPETISVGRGEVTTWGLRLTCEKRGEPVLTTTEIAEYANIPLAMAEDQLEELAELNEVYRKDVDGATLWSPADLRP